MIDRASVTESVVAESLANVTLWPIATNFSLGPDVSFRGRSGSGRAAEFAASVDNDPTETSPANFAVMHKTTAFSKDVAALKLLTRRGSLVANNSGLQNTYCTKPLRCRRARRAPRAISTSSFSYVAPTPATAEAGGQSRRAQRRGPARHPFVRAHDAERFCDTGGDAIYRWRRTCAR